MPYSPKTHLDSQSVAGEFKRMAEDQKAAVIAAVATADASDLDTAVALANALKTSHNNLIAALKTAGLMKTS